MPLSPIMSSLQDISFHLGRSPITIRPLWKLFSFFIWASCQLQWNHFEKSSYFSPLWKISVFFTTLKNLVFFTWAGRPLQQDRFEKSWYFSPLWKIFIFFTYLKNLCVFHLGRSPITIRPLWKISVFFTTLKNLRIFHHFEKISEKSLRFSPG